MNKTTLSAVFCALFAGSISAAPFMAVGTSSELFLTGEMTITANDNVTLGNDFVPPGGTQPFNPVRDDIVIRIAPGLSYEFGRNALISGKFAYHENIDFYQDNSDLDAALSNVVFNAAHDDGSSSTKINASYRQLIQNTVDVRLPTLSRRDVIKAKIEHEMELSAKSSLMFGVDWSDTDYQRNSLQDRDMVTLPLDYYWEASPKLDISLGGFYRTTNTDQAASSSDDFGLTLGARGDFTAKLKGFFKVGFVDRSIDNGRSRSSLSLASDFSYLYSEKTTFTAGVKNDFGNSGAGENQENFDVFLGFRSKMTPDFTLKGRVSFRQIDYFTRAADDYIEGSIGGEYVVNEYFQIHGMIALKDNDSALATGDFDNTVFSLTAKLRY